MGTTANKLSKVLETKSAIAEAIVEKGQSVSASDTFASYASKIRAIETGGADDVGPVTIVPTGTQFQKTAASEGLDGFDIVTVAGSRNLVARNIAKGIDIYGVTGSLAPNTPSVIPPYYQSYVDDALELYTGTYAGLFIEESDGFITVGFMMNNFTITEYAESVGFIASGWYYCRYAKATGTWSEGDFRSSSTLYPSPDHVEYIRYSSNYLYYAGASIYPVSDGSSDNQTDTTYPLSYVARYTSGDCTVYITGKANNYIAHVYGSGDMADYQVDSMPPWNSYMQQITSIIIHNGVTCVGTRAFWQPTWTGLLSTVRNVAIFLANTVKEIHPVAFLISDSNIAVVGGAGIEKLFFYAFGNTAAAPINILGIVWQIPSTIKYIDFRAIVGRDFFENCTDEYLICGDGCLIKYCGSTTALVLPETIKCINLVATATPNALLSSIDFPNSQLKYITRGGFSGQTGLTAMELPSSLQQISTYSFQNCTGLRKIFIPSGVETIDGTSQEAMTAATSPFIGCTSNLHIFCEAQSKPDGWNEYWNYNSQTTQLTVHWGVTREEYRQA